MVLVFLATWSAQFYFRDIIYLAMLWICDVYPLFHFKGVIPMIFLYMSPWGICNIQYVKIFLSFVATERCIYHRFRFNFQGNLDLKMCFILSYESTSRIHFTRLSSFYIIFVDRYILIQVSSHVCTLKYTPCRFV